MEGEIEESSSNWNQEMIMWQVCVLMPNYNYGPENLKRGMLFNGQPTSTLVLVEKEYDAVYGITYLTSNLTWSQNPLIVWPVSVLGKLRCLNAFAS